MHFALFSSLTNYNPMFQYPFENHVHHYGVGNNNRNLYGFCLLLQSKSVVASSKKVPDEADHLFMVAQNIPISKISSSFELKCFAMQKEKFSESSGETGVFQAPVMSQKWNENEAKLRPCFWKCFYTHNQQNDNALQHIDSADTKNLFFFKRRNPEPCTQLIPSKSEQIRWIVSQIIVQLKENLERRRYIKRVFTPFNSFTQPFDAEITITCSSFLKPSEIKETIFQTKM